MEERGLSHVADEFEIEAPDGSKHKGYVGLGDPRNPYSGQLLTEDEEKRIDSQGNPVVNGLSWTAASTGLFLSVLAAPMQVLLDRKIFGGSTTRVPLQLTKGAQLGLFVGTTLGRPVVGVECFGACLELPVDLGRDELKRKYITEWIAHTAIEALSSFGIGFDLTHKDLGQYYQNLAMSLAAAAEDSIVASGL